MSKRGKGYGRKSKTEEERRAIGGAINSQIQKRDGQGIDIQKREGGIRCNCLLQPGKERGGDSRHATTPRFPTLFLHSRQNKKKRA